MLHNMLHFVCTNKAASISIIWNYLIFIQILIDKFVFSLFLKSDDDQSHKDVDEEEGEHNKVDHVENGHLHSESGQGTSVFKGGVHGMLENSGE